MLSIGCDHLPGDLFDELGRDHGRNAQGVSSGVEFHDIRTDDRDFEGMKDPNHFPGGEPSRFVMGNAGGKGGVQDVQVEGHVDGSLKVDRNSRIPVFHLDDLDTETPGLFGLVRIHTPDTELNQTACQALFHDPGKGARMGEAVAVECLV